MPTIEIEVNNVEALKKRIEASLVECTGEPVNGYLRYHTDADMSALLAEIKQKRIRECRIYRVAYGWEVQICGSWLVGWNLEVGCSKC